MCLRTGKNVQGSFLATKVFSSGALSCRIYITYKCSMPLLSHVLAVSWVREISTPLRSAKDEGSGQFVLKSAFQTKAGDSHMRHP